MCLVSFVGIFLVVSCVYSPLRLFFFVLVIYSSVPGSFFVIVYNGNRDRHALLLVFRRLFLRQPPHALGDEGGCQHVLGSQSTSKKQEFEQVHDV